MISIDLEDEMTLSEQDKQFLTAFSLGHGMKEVAKQRIKIMQRVADELRELWVRGFAKDEALIKSHAIQKLVWDMEIDYKKGDYLLVLTEGIKDD